MPLESLQPDARSSIKRMSVESEQQDSSVFFDVKKDIGPNAIEDFEGVISRMRNKSLEGFLETAYEYLTLYPERRDKIESEEDLWESVKKEMEGLLLVEEPKNHSKNKLLQFVINAGRIKTIWPDKFPEIKLMAGDLLNNFRIDLNTVVGYPEIIEFFYDKIEEMKKNGKLKWEDAFKKLKGLEVKEGDINQSWIVFNERAAVYRLMFPDEFSFNKIQRNWKKILKALQEIYENNTTRVFLRDVFNVQILLAEKVEITDKGIELTLPEKNEEEKIPPVPQVKR